MSLQRNLSQSYGPMNQRVNFHAESTDNVFFGPDATITDENTCVEDVTSPSRGDIWPLLTPVSYDTVNDYFVIWDNTRSIDGFLIGKTGTSLHSYHGERTGRLKLYAASQTRGLIMTMGELNASDVVLPPGTGAASDPTQAELEAALKDGPRGDGFKIRGLKGVH